jgi:hypothetical protein
VKKTIQLFALAGAACVTSGFAQAADSPAQAGYCMEYLRTLVTDVNKSLPPLPADAPPEVKAAHDAAVTTLRQTDAKVRSLFDQWQLYGLSLPSMDSQVTTEFLRGIAQAKADLAYIYSQTKLDESDPMASGIRERAAPCARGPSL